MSALNIFPKVDFAATDTSAITILIGVFQANVLREYFVKFVTEFRL